MRALMLALVVTAALQAQSPARDAVGEARATTSVLEGIVTTADQDRRVVRRARAVLAPVEGRGATRQATTDDGGRFRFEGVPAGRYTLTVTKAGYVRTAFGARRMDGPGTPITLGEGARVTGLVVPIARGAVITGSITDHTGLPAAGVQVRAMQYRPQASGVRALVNASGVSMERTDDRGMFRFYGLVPGEYVIVATPAVDGTPAGRSEIRAMTDREIRDALAVLQNPQQAGARRPAAQPSAATEADATTVGFAPVYYPGTTSAADAARVVVAAGEERADISFALRMVRTARVEGTLVVPAGVPPQMVQLFLLPSNADGATITGVPDRATVDAQGRFRFAGVAPGQYVLNARVGSGPMVMELQGGEDNVRVGARVAAPGLLDADLPSLWGMTEVAVDGQPIVGLSVSLHPALTLDGRVIIEPGAGDSALDPSAVRVALAPVVSGGPTFQTAPTVRMGNDGTFTITGVTPGRYRLTATPATGSGWHLKAASLGGRDVLDLPIEIPATGSHGQALLTFSDRTQQVSGSLRDAAGRPATDYTILVFASDEKYWSAGARRVRTARPATDGQFTIADLPAGEYRIAAVTDILPNEASDPAFLQSLRDAAIPFTLAHGERRVQDFRIGQ